MSWGNIQRCCPVLDLDLCSVDIESRQIRGHHRVRRCQLIHHAGCISSKNPHRHFPPKACSLPWYHTQSIHYRGGWQRQFNLHTVASLFFFSAMTSSIYSPIALSAQETYHGWHPCCRQESCSSRKRNESILVYFFLSVAHRHGDACHLFIFWRDGLVVCQHFSCVWFAAVERFDILGNTLIRFLAES